MGRERVFLALLKPRQAHMLAVYLPGGAYILGLREWPRCFVSSQTGPHWSHQGGEVLKALPLTINNSAGKWAL